MSSINLLPWREKLAERQKNQYFAMLFCVALIAFCCIYGGSQWLNMQISQQEQRNLFLQQKISQLDADIGKIQHINAKRDSLAQRMGLIETLQQSRNTTAVIFSELAAQTPEGIRLSYLSRVDNTLLIDGSSNSNNRLSHFIRNLSESDYFINPELSSITATPNSAQAMSEFRLTLSLSELIAPSLDVSEDTLAQQGASR